MNTPICPYCSKPSTLVNGDAIYPNRRDLALLKYHRCEPCQAHVGCHRVGAFTFKNDKKTVSDGTLPLGRLANAELRAAKQAAHAAFDPIWQDNGRPRRAVYAWLANKLGLSFDDTHIGEFDVARCHQVRELALRYREINA